MLDNAVTKVRGHPELSSDYSTPIRAESLSISLLLYDFGGTRAGMDNAESLLDAARAEEEAAVQQVFADTAKAYFIAEASQARLKVDAAAILNARLSMDAARARIDRGVAPATEGFQAETAYEQALLDQSAHQSQAAISMGELADAMSLPPDTLVTLPVPDLGQHFDKEYQESVRSLIEKAEKNHPAVISAEKNYAAAQASARQVKSQGRPTIKLIAQYNQNNQPAQLGLGTPHYPATGRDAYVGVQINVPLFTGFANTYQLHEAEARAEAQAATIDEVRQKIALGVWESYQALVADEQSLSSSERLVRVTTEAWESAERRYRLGVGTIIELLSTQSALGRARQQRVEAIVDWRYHRLALAAALGRLSLSDAR